MFKNILVGLDGSDPSTSALVIACDLATKYGANLYLVHSPQIETTAIAVGSGAVVIEPEPETIAAAGQKVMEAAHAKAKEVGCDVADSFVGNGDPAGQILKHAKSTNADLIVLGRRGLGSMSSLLLGSVSQKVSHDAECACLTVSH